MEYYEIYVDGDRTYSCNTLPEVGEFIKTYFIISDKLTSTGVFNFDQVTISIITVKKDNADG